MIQTIDFHIPSLECMKVYPKPLYYLGRTELLSRPKLSIVGTRHPITYTKVWISTLAQKLSQVGVCIVSGGAQGVDSIAHQSAGLSNTIMVAVTYNKKLEFTRKNFNGFSTVC